MDNLLARITLPESHAANESILKEEEILKPPVDLEDKEPDEGVVIFDEKEDYELARALEEALLTPPPLEFDLKAALHV